MVDVGGQIICGLYDPCDYVQTGVNIVQGEAGVLETFAMATPILPTVVGRWGDELLGWGSDVVQWAGNKIDDAIGAFCSFSEDTLVMTEDGLMPISEVGLYEMVLAYNEETGEVGYYPVVAVWAHEDPVIVTLTIEGETIETTPEHPFYTDEGEWLPAASLQVGDEIRTSDWGTGTVEAIQFTHNPQLMYNFTVATAHTYFVGQRQWLVHNDCITSTLESVQDKLTRYLLNEAHDNGGTKARWFREALGFTQANMDDLAQQIVFDESAAYVTYITEYGVKYNQTISITGANGRIINVLVGWIKRNGEDFARLVTAIPGD